MMDINELKKVADVRNESVPKHLRNDNVAARHYTILHDTVSDVRGSVTVMDNALIEKAAKCHSNIQKLEDAVDEMGMYTVDSKGDVKRNGVLQDLKGVRDSYLKYAQELGLTAKVLGSLNKGKPQSDGKFSY